MIREIVDAVPRGPPPAAPRRPRPRAEPRRHPSSGGISASRKARLAFRPRLRGFHLAVARCGGRAHRTDEPPRRLGDLRDAALEGFLVRPRGPREAAELPDELERGGADLVI